jgi:hypothetical protein
MLQAFLKDWAGILLVIVVLSAMAVRDWVQRKNAPESLSDEEQWLLELAPPSARGTRGRCIAVAATVLRANEQNLRAGSYDVVAQLLVEALRLGPATEARRSRTVAEDRKTVACKTCGSSNTRVVEYRPSQHTFRCEQGHTTVEYEGDYLHAHN